MADTKGSITIDLNVSVTLSDEVAREIKRIVAQELHLYRQREYKRLMIALDNQLKGVD